jgi:hypothetical protein
VNLWDFRDNDGIEKSFDQTFGHHKIKSTSPVAKAL